MYRRIFEKLVESEPSLNPVDATTDFELAPIAAAKKVFPTAILHCCFFHFCHAIWHKIQEFGMRRQ